MRYGWLFIAIMAAASLSSGSTAAEVYTWTDDNGLVHITDRPPPRGARIRAVVEDKRLVVETVSPGTREQEAVTAAQHQIEDSESAWQKVQSLGEKLNAAKVAYEDAAAAAEAEEAKFSYSAKRRRAPRENVVELQEKAQQAFSYYRQILDAFNKAELVARQTEERTRRVIEEVGKATGEAPRIVEGLPPELQ